ncbi:hypothetical protein M9H77_31825 [Catharanthus roseus]|uniref:Uncharacterized protein n=1 Tax=Catharanthus roseus TaxID=4058 RepID=A0ACC0A5E3_CATRO|nr:hypothetical protein M9H77_31825 [Catharanthus roseus]
MIPIPHYKIEASSLLQTLLVQFLGIEVVLWVNGIEDLKGFKIKQLVPRGKGIWCKECEGYGHIQGECANTFKKNLSMNTTLIDNDDKKSDSENDEEDIDSNETLAFNVIIDLKDTSMHNDYKGDSDDGSIYSDEEVCYEELQNKYSLIYTKWVELVKLYQDLKDSLKKIQEQKDALEERNYELMAQVKDATKRVNAAEGKIARLNTRKTKLDEIIFVGRPAGMKSGLGYTGTNLNHIIGMHVTQYESSYTMFGK